MALARMAPALVMGPGDAWRCDRLKMRSGIPSAAIWTITPDRTRVHGRPAGTAFAVERGATSIALDIHFENGGMVDQAIDRGERHGPVWKDLSPFRAGTGVHAHR